MAESIDMETEVHLLSARAVRITDCSHGWRQSISPAGSAANFISERGLQPQPEAGEKEMPALPL